MTGLPGGPVDTVERARLNSGRVVAEMIERGCSLIDVAHAMAFEGFLRCQRDGRGHWLLPLELWTWAVEGAPPNLAVLTWPC